MATFSSSSLSPSRESASFTNRKLAVHCIPVGTTKDELLFKFKRYGAIQSIVLLPSRPGARYSLGLVEYTNHMSACAAKMELNNTKWGNCVISVDWARPKAGETATLAPNEKANAVSSRISGNGHCGATDGPSLAVQVKNIPITITQSMLHQLFGKCGKIKVLYTIIPPGIPPPPTYSVCLQFSRAEEASIAIAELDGKMLHGTRIAVQPLHSFSESAIVRPLLHTEPYPTKTSWQQTVCQCPLTNHPTIPTDVLQDYSNMKFGCPPFESVSDDGGDGGRKGNSQTICTPVCQDHHSSPGTPIRPQVDAEESPLPSWSAQEACCAISGEALPPSPVTSSSDGSISDVTGSSSPLSSHHSSPAYVFPSFQNTHRGRALAKALGHLQVYTQTGDMPPQKSASACWPTAPSTKQTVSPSSFAQAPVSAAECNVSLVWSTVPLCTEANVQVGIPPGANCCLSPSLPSLHFSPQQSLEVPLHTPTPSPAPPTPSPAPPIPSPLPLVPPCSTQLLPLWGQLLSSTPSPPTPPLSPLTLNSTRLSENLQPPHHLSTQTSLVEHSPGDGELNPCNHRDTNTNHCTSVNEIDAAGARNSEGNDGTRSSLGTGQDSLQPTNPVECLEVIARSPAVQAESRFLRDCCEQEPISQVEFPGCYSTQGVVPYSIESSSISTQSVPSCIEASVSVLSNAPSHTAATNTTARQAVTKKRKAVKIAAVFPSNQKGGLPVEATEPSRLELRAEVFQKSDADSPHCIDNHTELEYQKEDVICQLNSTELLQSSQAHVGLHEEVDQAVTLNEMSSAPHNLKLVQGTVQVPRTYCDTSADSLILPSSLLEASLELDSDLSGCVSNVRDPLLEARSSSSCESSLCMSGRCDPLQLSQPAGEDGGCGTLRANLPEGSTDHRDNTGVATEPETSISSRTNDDIASAAYSELSIVSPHCSVALNSDSEKPLLPQPHMKANSGTTQGSVAESVTLSELKKTAAKLQADLEKVDRKNKITSEQIEAEMFALDQEKDEPYLPLGILPERLEMYDHIIHMQAQWVFKNELAQYREEQEKKAVLSAEMRMAKDSPDFLEFKLCQRIDTLKAQLSASQLLGNVLQLKQEFYAM